MADRPIDLGWLRLFEAIGRQQNLTRVAEELRLSQPAVSYQLRRIEQSVGAPLVRRLHRGAEMTREGEILHEAIRDSLSMIDEAVKHIRRRGRQSSVRLHTDFGFASYWLMPRISAFRRLEPDVEVHVVASQSMKTDDHDDADLHVLFGQKANFGEDALQLTEERVWPVCTPGYFRRHGPFETAADLARQTLIHLEGDADARWFSWQSWLRDAGIVRQPAVGDLSMNAYNLVIQAALAEQGIALGWAGLVDDLVKSGLLMKAGATRTRAEHGYWLISSRPGETSAQKLTDWLIEESRTIV